MYCLPSATYGSTIFIHTNENWHTGWRGREKLKQMLSPIWEVPASVPRFIRLEVIGNPLGKKMSFEKQTFTILTRIH